MLRDVIKVNIYNNPFDTKESYSLVFKENIRIEKVLSDIYGKNYKNTYNFIITINDIEVYPEQYDKFLKIDDICNIIIKPKGQLVEDVGRLGRALIAPLIKSDQEIIDLPTNLNNIEQEKSKSYSYRLSENLARLGEAIPSQYGKIKWYPDLVTSPFIRYENNEHKVRFLLCLGHGEHEINDILIGKTSVINNTDITYNLVTPNSGFTSFDDNILTLKEVKNVNLVSGSFLHIYDRQVSFNKAAATITFNTGTIYRSYNLDHVFGVDDEIRIFSEYTTDFNGVYTISSITSTVITVTDSSSWTSSSGTPFRTSVWLNSEIEVNPYYSIKGRSGGDLALPYFVKNTFTKTFIINNFYKSDFNLEIDYEIPDALAIYYEDNVIDPLNSPFANPAAYLIPIDSSGTDITIHYKLEYLLTLSSIGSNQYQAGTNDRNWKNNIDLTDINFPTIENPTFNNDFYFSANNVKIPDTEVSSIDYTNGIVTFNTAQSGTIRVHNAILLQNYMYQPIQGEFGRWLVYTDPARKIYEPKDYNLNNTKRYYDFGQNTDSLFRDPIIGYEINVYDTYKCMIYNDKTIGAYYTNINDKIKIKRVKIKYPQVKYYGDLSLLSLEITNKNEEEQIDLKDISVITTRKLPVWNGSVWSAPTATRSIAWALADIYMSEYGGQKSYQDLDLAKLLTLDSTWTSRGDTFDAIFDSQSSIFEALEKVARCGRCKPYYEGTKLTFVRDESKSNFTALYNSANILSNSFKINYNFSDIDTAKGILLKYIDENNNYEPSKVYSSENASKYKEVDFFGCVNYEQAWRESQYLEKKLLTNHKIISFSTEMSGHIPKVLDKIIVNMDLPNWASGGYVKNKSGTTITTTEPLDFTGTSPFYITFQKPNGAVSGPHTVTQGSTEFEAILDTDVTDFTFITSFTNQVPTIYEFGDSTNYNKALSITKITPKQNNSTFDIECIEYIDSVYTADTGTPPTQEDSAVNLNLSVIPSNLVPKISGLKLSNVAGSGSVIAIWNDVNNISNYKVQKSTDNITWTNVSTPSSATSTISATGTLYVRVACVIGSVIGDYTSGVIIAT